MARFSANQIYAFAREAGFSPDEAATMTAIALAESGGNARAHNPRGEDSRGLWQINARAHPDLAARLDLYDPRDNAMAAFQVSRRGEDVSPWTTTHGGTSASYVRFRDRAEAAALAYGDGPGRGMWAGTSGYGDPVDAGADLGSGAGLTDLGGLGGGSADVFLRVALAQAGDPYVWGATARASDPDPDAFDCSELTKWAAAQAGVELPDGSMYQYLFAKEHGYLVPVSEAVGVPGALLFDFSTEPQPGGARPSSAHVAISLGDGTTIEAAGTSYGVTELSAEGRFRYAAVVPGLTGGDPDAATMSELLATDGLDIDRDGISDQDEIGMGLDPMTADTDRDGVTDGYEVLVLQTSARRADTDDDGFGDAFEIAHGLDPTQPDIGAGSELDSEYTAALSELDVDGLGGAALAPADEAFGDSDLDGFSDSLEQLADSDPWSSSSTPLHPGAEHISGLGDDDLDDA